MHFLNWREPPTKLSLPGEGGLHLWLIDLSVENRIDAGRLSADENKRSQRILSKKLRQRNLVSTTAMREILADYLNTDPWLIEFVVGIHGKPALRKPNSKLQFNLTHSEDLALFALSWNCPVGIDTEMVRGRKYLLQIAKRMFDDEAYQSILEHRGEKRTHTFLEHWTCYEAKIKTLGITLFSESEAMEDLTAVNFQPIENAIAAIAMPVAVPPQSSWCAFRWHPT